MYKIRYIACFEASRPCATLVSLCMYILYIIKYMYSVLIYRDECATYMFTISCVVSSFFGGDAIYNCFLCTRSHHERRVLCINVFDSNEIFEAIV